MAVRQNKKKKRKKKKQERTKKTRREKWKKKGTTATQARFPRGEGNATAFLCARAPCLSVLFSRLASRYAHSVHPLPATSYLSLSPRRLSICAAPQECDGRSVFIFCLQPNASVFLAACRHGRMPDGALLEKKLAKVRPQALSSCQQIALHPCLARLGLGLVQDWLRTGSGRADTGRRARRALLDSARRNSIISFLPAWLFDVLTALGGCPHAAARHPAPRA